MKNYLYQAVEEIKGIEKSVVQNDLKIKDSEVWKPNELKGINNILSSEKGGAVRELLWEGKDECPEIQDLIDLINHKRCLVMKTDEGIKRIAIPSFEPDDKLNAMSRKLLSIALTHLQYKGATKEEEKEELLGHLNRNWDTLIMDIAKVFLSKNFKKNYKFKFTGFTSIALTGHLSPDGVAIPKSFAEKFHVKIGDLCIVKRDPLQNIFITLKVEKFHEERVVRINPQTFLLTDGDFDGDQVSVIPVNNLIRENKEYIGSQGAQVRKELGRLLPSVIMNNARYNVLTREYQDDFNAVTEPVRTYEEIFNASKKSKEFSKGKSELPNYLDNHLENVRNMLTVQEGTAIAGGFCNWVMEVARNYGLDMVVARGLSNRLQRVALDSKHTTGIANYKELAWCQLAELKKRRTKYQTVEEIELIIDQIIDGEVQANDQEFEDDIDDYAI